MSADQGNNSTPPAPGQPRRVIITPPPAARSTRRTPEQVITNPAADAFATPSVGPASEPTPMSGNEPAIFGGINPPTTYAGQPSTSPPEVMGITPSGESSNEDEMTTGPITRPNPYNIVRFILRSNTAMLLLLSCVLIIGTWAIVGTVAVETYVHVSIKMRAASLPTAQEAEVSHGEINSILRAYPLRSAAKNILSKTVPNMSPGFLDNMLFFGPDAITWTDPATLSLRFNTVQPGEDALRMGAVAQAFMQVAHARDLPLQEHQQRLANLQLHRDELHRQQDQLQKDGQTRVPGTLATTASADAELASALKQRMEKTTAEIAAEQRLLDTWLQPEGIDPAGVQIYDNRILRRNLLLMLWLGLLALVGTPIFLNALRLRKQRREKKRRHK